MLRAPVTLLKPEHLDPAEVPYVDRLNEAATFLGANRPLIVDGANFRSSKLAWQLKTYQSALLYRTVSLFDGAAGAINQTSPLVSLLAGRALMETVALQGELLAETSRALEIHDLCGFKIWLVTRIFATRDKDLLALSSETISTPATNIMTIMKHFEAGVDGPDGFGEIYDRLSEYCHPNGLGHHFMFGKLDTQAHTMTYSDEQGRKREFGLLLTALASIHFVVDWLPLFEEQVQALIERDLRLRNSASKPA